MFAKINAYLSARKEDVYVFAIIVLVALLSFGLGRLSALSEGQGEFRIIEPEGQAAAAVLSEGGEVVASKNGSAYYLPFCGGASRIKPENLVRFESSEAAEKAGYRPAANCKGL